MATVTVAGIEHGYDDTGAGEALVLVHGHPFDRSMWRPQAEHLSRQGWRVITPDLRGYGATTVVPGTTTLEDFARDLAGLLDHLGIGRIVLGGLSMGGQIVMEFHRLFPDRSRGLLLADTSPAADAEAGRKARIDTADRIVGEGMDRYADELLPMMVAPRTLHAQPAVAAHVHAMMCRTSPHGAAAALRGRARRRDYGTLLGEITVPTLVVVGRADEFTPVETAELIQRRVTDSTLTIVEDAGHLPNLEQPDAFNTAVAAFLESLAATATRQPRRDAPGRPPNGSPG